MVECVFGSRRVARWAISARRVAGAVALLAIPGLSAHAEVVTFGFTGHEDYFSVPLDGDYLITAGGAQGGGFGSGFPGEPATIPGGKGAIVGGDFHLTAGSLLTLFVGGAGQNGTPYEGAGGGGRTVVDLYDLNAAILIAGGGGGTGIAAAFGDARGSGGQAGQTGLGFNYGVGQGGEAGQPPYSSHTGLNQPLGGGGGGGTGELSAGGKGAGQYGGYGGDGVTPGLGANVYPYGHGGSGGYGGGGGGDFYYASGGGGGGYTGGAGGQAYLLNDDVTGEGFSGQGGGSFNASLYGRIGQSGANPGNGFVTIAYTVDTPPGGGTFAKAPPPSPPPSAVPEPAAWTMMLIGFGAIGAAMRGRRRLIAGGAGSLVGQSA